MDNICTKEKIFSVALELFVTGVSSKINQGIKITGIGCDEDQSGF